MKKSRKIILILLTLIISISLIVLSACSDSGAAISSKMSKSELKEALDNVSNYTVETLVEFREIEEDSGDEIIGRYGVTVEYDGKANIAHVNQYETYSPFEGRTNVEQYITKDANYEKYTYWGEEAADPWEKIDYGNIDELMDLDDDGDVLVLNTNILLVRTMIYIKKALADPDVKADANGWYSYKDDVNYSVTGYENYRGEDSFELKFKVNDKGEIEFNYDLASANKMLY